MAHTSSTREQRLMYVTQPEKNKDAELPKPDVNGNGEVVDALQPSNERPEIPAEQRLEESNTEAAERAAKEKAAQEALKKTEEAEKPANAEKVENMDVDAFSKKFDSIVAESRDVYFELQKNPTPENFELWNQAVRSESRFIENYQDVWDAKDQDVLKAKVMDRKKAIEIAKTITLEMHQGAKKGNEKIDQDDAKLSKREKREQNAFMIGGEFAVEMLEYSKATNSAYQKYRMFPEEETQKAMIDAAKVEEQFILAHQDQWRDGKDSLKERNAMNRLAAIEEMGRMDWRRQAKKLEWQERQRQETEKAHEKYEADLRGLLVQAEQSGYPLDSRIVDFVNTAIEKMNNTRDAWRKCDTPAGKNPDLQMTFREAARASQAVEQAFIEMGYNSWNNTIIEQVVRNRHIQLGGKDVLNRNYQDELALVREGGIPTQDKKIREWLAFQDKSRGYPKGTSTKRFVDKQGKPRPINLSDLSDFDRDQYLRWNAYGRGRITQDEFDDHYFSTNRKSDINVPQRLKDKMFPMINGVVEAAMLSLLPAPDPIEGPISTSAIAILDAWNSVNAEIKNEDPIWQLHFQELFLQELNRRMPDRVCAVKATWNPMTYSFTLIDDDGAFRMYAIENGQLRNMNKGQQVPSQNTEQQPAEEEAVTRRNEPLNIRAPNIGPTTLNRPRNALLDSEDVGTIEDIDVPPAGPSRNRRGDNRNTFQPELTDEEIKQAAEDYVNMPKEDGTELTDEERTERKLNAAEKFGVEVHDDGSVDLPNDPEKVLENKNKATEQKLQKDYDGMSDANKSKKEVDLMMQYGATIENGKVVIPKEATAILMNKAGGMVMKVVEFFARIGEMWNKAFGKMTGAPAATPAAAPSNAADGKIKDKAEFVTEAELLKKTSDEAKGDVASYKSALDEEKRVLSLPDHAKYHDAVHTDRLKEIDRELAALNQGKTVESLPRDNSWHTEAGSAVAFKKTKNGSVLKKEGNDIFVRQPDGTWKDAVAHARINDPANAQLYKNIMAFTEEGAKEWVIFNKNNDVQYSYLDDGILSMKRRTKTGTGRSGAAMFKTEKYNGDRWVAV